MSTVSRPTCLELFAGCGGLGYGFHKQGFDIVCANELDYENHNITHLRNGFTHDI